MLVVPPTLGALRENLARHGVADQVKVHVGTVDDVPLPALIALAFVDGLHDAEHVRHDAQALRPRMAPGGLMLFHDYTALWPGVVDVVNQLYEQDEQLIWLPPRGVVAMLQVR
jgi:predicted O-methyltransferase YrrM